MGMKAIGKTANITQAAHAAGGQGSFVDENDHVERACEAEARSPRSSRFESCSGRRRCDRGARTSGVLAGKWREEVRTATCG